MDAYDPVKPKWEILAKYTGDPGNFIHSIHRIHRLWINTCGKRAALYFEPNTERFFTK